MKLQIKKNEENIIIGFNKKTLEVSLDPETNLTDWTTNKINEFLIDLADAVEDGDSIEIIYDEKEENKVYKHIKNLFWTFKKEFNVE
ncbi:hypothetical protein [Candidatus Mycoplasma mahonii]|uniref:hypothetical protein n=1 Tax=Candidatus Mycoplasma mahonii TaxID=3004105 RepID=UPI0026ECBDA6|nr:hypothetical protein [Candidatus Mycoplasma mahonii]WKX02766.1 hypothetical protein O3I44_01690 [Candidatus Mycoplasma mahonii]